MPMEPLPKTSKAYAEKAFRAKACRHAAMANMGIVAKLKTMDRIRASNMALAKALRRTQS